MHSDLPGSPKDYAIGFAPIELCSLLLKASFSGQYMFKRLPSDQEVPRQRKPPLEREALFDVPGLLKTFV